MSVLNAAHLGPTAYRDGLRLQEALVAAVAAARGAEPATPDWLLFPDHPSVLTVGRSPSAGNLRVPRGELEARGIEVFEVARGGDVTWHGPGQLVGYTVCDLDRMGHDLHRFLREIEQALLDALEGWGIAARRVTGRTGIWVGEEKIASIGVAVRRWVTYHGFALNVRPDLSHFELIHPCGLRGVRMTSLERLLGAGAPSLTEARRATCETLARRLGYAGAAWKPAEAAWMAARTAPGEPGGVPGGSRAERSREGIAAVGGAAPPAAA